MCEQLLSKAIISGLEDEEDSRTVLLNWLRGTSKQDDADFTFSRNDFALFFVNFIRSKTERYLNIEQNDETNVSENKENVTKPTLEQNAFDELNSSVIINAKNVENSLENPNCSIDRTTSNFTYTDESLCHSPSNNSIEVNAFNENFSTPKRNISFEENAVFSPVTPINDSSYSFDNSLSRFSTPNVSRTSTEITPNNKINKNHSRDRSINQYSGSKKPSNRNFCIGDFIVNNKNVNSENLSIKRKKNRFQNLSLDDPLLNCNKENATYKNCQMNNSALLNIDDKEMFPDIGSQRNHNTKSNTNQTRRINPTRLNMTFPTSSANNTAQSFGMNFGVKYDKIEQNEAFKMQNCQLKEHPSDFRTERDILKKEKINLIEKFNQMNNSSTAKKILPNSLPVNQIAIKHKNTKNITNCIFDMSKVLNAKTLEFLACVHSVIIDFNLIPNIVSELHYFISLAMIQHTNDTDDDNKEMENVFDNIFNCVHNCIYFGLGCLNKQKYLLSIVLDKNTLRLLIQNERVKIFSDEFADCLNSMHLQKHIVDDNILKNTISENFTNKNVYFITDTDSADNFPNYQNFIIFKSQRDGFYEILRFWEENHLIANWKFEHKLGPKVRSLVSLSTNPSNFTHLARLFKSQLLIACHAQEKTETVAELQSVIGGVSQNKLSKLAERLTGALPGQHAQIGQSNLNSPPDFTGCEEFFRDFIVYSNNCNFREHLIDSFVQEINRLDETGFVPAENEDSGNTVDEEAKAQYLLCIKSLRVLAKFLGFLMSLPYRYIEKSLLPMMSGVKKLGENKKNDDGENSKSIVVSSEIAARNLTLPPINLILILDNSYRKHRLVLTIPWLVQLLAMLDYCYLRLLYFQRLHEMLFSIFTSNVYRQNYEVSADLDQSIKQNTNTDNMKQIECYKEVILPYKNKCLIRICLGWLFDLQHFPQDLFHSWLKSINSRNETDDLLKFKLTDRNLVGLISNITPKSGKKNNLYVEDNQSENENEGKSTNSNLNDDDIKRLYNMSLEVKEEEFGFDLDSLEIVDDNVIKEICPFLKDFRFLFIKTQTVNGKREKAVRHITPVTSSFSVDKQKRKDKEIQMRLEEWFLRSQPGTTRRTMELVSERTGAALVRLAKTQIQTYCDRAYAAVQPLLKNADEESVEKKIMEIYNRQLLDFHIGCKKAGKHVGVKRVRGALQGLLPPGTHASILETCVQICTRNALRKLAYCLESQYNDISVLFNNNCKIKKILSKVDGGYLAVQRNIMMLNENKESDNRSEFKTTPDNSKTYDDVYCSPMMLIVELRDTIVNIINGVNIEDCTKDAFVLIEKLKKCTNYVYVDKFIKQIFLQLSLDLTIYLICFNPTIVDEKYLNCAKEAWKNCINVICDNIERTPDILDSEITSFKNHMGVEGRLTEETNINDTVENDNRLDEHGSDVKNSLTEHDKEVYDNHFDTVLCSRNLMLIGDYWITKNDEKWKALGSFLVFILENNFVSEKSLTEQIVAIYRQDHTQEFLQNIAKCVRGLVEKCQLHSNEKLSLILEFISDYCHDLEDDYL